MKLSDMIRQALESKGYHNLKDASKALGLSPELLRVTMNKGHIPKDTTLIMIANKLSMDKTILILTAHQEKVPFEVKGFFLAPSEAKLRRDKRKYPLSEEQCNYLARLMSTEEIQMIRKLRQVSEEANIQIMGYIDYLFASKKGS
jgi:hypothetical protein